MNTYRWLQQKVLRTKYRKYALRISLVVHVIMMIATVFFIKSEVQELEDEFEVELIKAVPRRVAKKKPTPIPKVETEPEPEPPKPEMPQITQNRPERRKMTSEKAVTAVQPKPSVDVAKLPIRTSPGVEMQQPSVKRSEVDAPTFSETPDVATAADLPTSPESVLSPIGATEGSPEHGRQRKRSHTGVRSPSTGAGEGVRKAAQTGARKTTGKTIGTIGKKKGSGTGGSSDGSATFSSIIGDLTDDIIASSGGNPIDVVFVVDASGSMQDNINAVAEHLGQMVDAYTAAEIEYQLGLTHFNATQPSQRTQENKIQVFQLAQDLSIYKRRLYEIVPTGDENALDALSETVGQLRFRTHTIKHLILVTDEPFTSLQGHTVESIIKLCQSNELFVHVLGLAVPEHRQIASETGGSWHAVPEDPMQQRTQASQSRPVDAQAIGDLILADGANSPVDVIFFIDSSKSMTDKMPYLTQQIDLWIRNWDHAIIDYRIGVVRFRAKQSVNIVNVFKPPQTQAQIHKILQLPCQDDENLLHAVVEGERRLTRRPNVKTHFIFMTDEPGNPKAPIAGTIGLLSELPVVVSVIGASDPFQQQVASQTGGVYVRMPNAYTRSTSYE
ncbi:VWA domain-containing protein [Candidatus Poribacteria bacterium]|nr:VWA domain-containing protein [Candidatus Poribacteria bacterium]